MGGNGAAMGPANDKSGGTNHLGDEGAYRGPRAAKRKGAFDQAAGESAKAGGAKKAAPATPPVLVVLCDVAPAALQSRAFDKLLDANGVTGHRQPPRRGAAYGAGMPGRPESNGAPALKEKEATAKGQSPTPQAEPEDAIYIEATPAQVKAVLAGLAAQPEVFIAVSAQPVEGRPAEEIVRQYRPARRGDARFRSAVFGARQDHMDQEPSQGAAGPAKSKAPADGKKAEQPPAPAAPALPGAGAAPAAPAPSPAPAGADRKPTAPPPRERAFEQREAEKSQPEKPAEEDRHQQAPRPQRAAQPAPPQRVLFVLRAAGGQPPTASKDSAEKKHE
jgi:ribonuclease E